MRRNHRRVIWLVALTLSLPCTLLSLPSHGMHQSFEIGDIFIGISTGQVQWRRPDGTLVHTLNTGLTGEITGMAFDEAMNLYATAFTESRIVKFDPSGNLIGPFGGVYNLRPESILFDAHGNVYVGQADGTRDILKLDSAGNPLGSFNVATQVRGSDWIDLAADNCTMFYTSQGTDIKRFDVCTNTQLPDFATGLHGPANALRILQNGEVLVVDAIDIHRLDSSGNIVQTYDLPGDNFWFALNLDPNGTSFWSADNACNFTNATVYKFNITTGAVEFSFDTGANTVGGLVIKGGITASQEACNLSLPGLVKARAGSAIGFMISNTGPSPEPVTISPFFNSACFSIFPGAPQQVVVPPGGVSPFWLNATPCPTNAGSQVRNALIVVESRFCGTKYVQVEWVKR